MRRGPALQDKRAGGCEGGLLLQRPGLLKSQSNFRAASACPCSIPAAQRHFTVVLAEQVAGARPLGVRQVERCLPVGAMLTAVGELNAAVEHPSAFKVGRLPAADGRRLPPWCSHLPALRRRGRHASSC